MTITKLAVCGDRPASPSELLAEIRRLGLRSPSEAAGIVRSDRDAR